MSSISIYTIHLPKYRVDNGEPDSETIGKIVDDELKKHFLGEDIVFRGVASSEHSDKSQDKLVEIIKTSGTDRYDAERKGDRYENIEGKHIDFFAFPCKVTSDLEIGHMMIWGFYHSAIAIHAHPMRIDIISVYDTDKLDQVYHQYQGRSDIKDDGFAFKDTKYKPAAIKGIFKITG